MNELYRKDRFQPCVVKKDGVFRIRESRKHESGFFWKYNVYSRDLDEIDSIPKGKRLHECIDLDTAEEAEQLIKQVLNARHHADPDSWKVVE